MNTKKEKHQTINTKRKEDQAMNTRKKEHKTLRLAIVEWLMPAGYHLKKLPKPYRHRKAKKQQSAQFEIPITDSQLAT